MTDSTKGCMRVWDEGVSVMVPIRDTIRAGDAVSRVDTIDQTGRGRLGRMCVGVMVCVRRDYGGV